jgi:outer membrane protein
MIKKLCIALAVATLAPVVMAQSAGDIVMRARAVRLQSANGDSTGLGLSINDKWIPEVDFTYFVTPNIAAELILTYPQKQTVHSSVLGQDLGDFKHLPPTLTAQYHFTNLGPIKPYLGAGINYTNITSVHILNGAVNLKRNSFGLALQAGVDYAIDKTWSLNFDVKKVQISTKVYVAGTDVGKFKVDPLLIGAGVGYKF